MIGNSCGGALRCPHCNADFTQSSQLWSYAHLKSCEAKTLVSLNDLLSNPSSGIIRQSGIFAACASEDEEQKLKEAIKHCRLAVDPLHNIKGHLSNIILSMRKWSCWNEAIFVKLLGDIIQRKAVSDLDGAHMRLVLSYTYLPFSPILCRLLAEMHKEVILPALKDKCPPDVLAKVEQLFEGFAEVLAFYVGILFFFF